MESCQWKKASGTSGGRLFEGVVVNLIIFRHKGVIEDLAKHYLFHIYDLTKLIRYYDAYCLNYTTMMQCLFEHKLGETEVSVLNFVP